MHPTQQFKIRLARLTLDQLTLFQINKCYLLPILYSHLLQMLSDLESSGKLCLTPATILERYHYNLKYKKRKVCQKIA